MSLEEDYAAVLSAVIAKEIDSEILWGRCVVDCASKGWHSVNITRFTDNYHAIDITTWIEDNVKGKHHRNGRYFIFEDSKDAAWFLLRWS